MGITIGAKTDSSFDDPLGLLSDCHRRIEKFLQSMQVVVAEAEPDPSALNERQRHAIEVALRYFREAAPRHTRDEEESLFPKLRACGDESVKASLAAIDALEADHETADAGHAEADALGRKWLAENRLTSEEIARLGAILQSLQSLYQNHIAIEDSRIFPLAGQVLDPQTIQAVGREMAERRGIDLDALTGLKLRCPTRRSGITIDSLEAPKSPDQR